MKCQTLLADPAAIALEKIVPTTEGLTLAVRTILPHAEGPRCGVSSARVHSRYQRTVADLPWQGITVRLELRARRFRCDNSLCEKSVFCEPLPSAVARYARRTIRLAEALEEIAFALGGRPGSRLARELAMAVSRHTLLRAIRRAARDKCEPPTALGVDDWAKRKGREYDTVLVDLVRRRVIDLLPDRTAETLAAWLKLHPEVEVITRDRAAAYAEAVNSALPQALQVADRWHLLKNATELLDRLLQRKGRAVREAAKSVRDEWAARVEELPAPETRQVVLSRARRENRLARYEEIIEMHRQGASVRAIARALRLSRNTVTKYVQAGAFPERRPAPPKRSIVEEFAAYVAMRWDEGCHNASQLWRELRERGFTGGRTSVCLYVKRRRREVPAHLRPWGRLPEESSRPPRASAPSPRSAAWLLQQEESELRPDERQLVSHLVSHEPDIRDATGLMRRFRRMVRGRQAGEFDAWLAEAAASPLAEVRNFAEALRRDYRAVRAALEHDWSNGQAEGQVNRLKLIKRQMFGRAKFDLLKARVLHTT